MLAASVLASCGISYDRTLPSPVQGEEVRPSASDAGPIVNLASFSAEVLVLHRKDYPRKPQDPLSVYAPMDIVAAWGEAGRKDVRDPVHIAQNNRRYGWSYHSSVPVPKATSSFGILTANWHLIPANDRIRDVLDDIGKGDVVRLTGHLVKARLSNGSWAVSSLTRDDVGDGACEIIQVDSATIL